MILHTWCVQFIYLLYFYNKLYKLLIYLIINHHTIIQVCPPANIWQSLRVHHMLVRVHHMILETTFLWGGRNKIFAIPITELNMDNIKNEYNILFLEYNLYFSDLELASSCLNQLISSLSGLGDNVIYVNKVYIRFMRNQKRYETCAVRHKIG